MINFIYFFASKYYFWLIDSNSLWGKSFFKDKEESNKYISYMFIEELIIMGINGKNPPLMKN